MRSSDLYNGYRPIYRYLSRCGDDLSASEVRVLLNLLERLGQNDTVWPSQELIAEDTGLVPNTVRPALRSLEAKGFLSSHRRGQGKTNEYTLNMEAILTWAKEGLKRKAASSRSTENGVQEARELPFSPIEVDPIEVVPVKSGASAPRTQVKTPRKATWTKAAIEDIATGYVQIRAGGSFLGPTEAIGAISQILRVAEEFDPLLGQTFVDRQVEAALNHTAALKAINLATYVRVWLNRDLARSRGNDGPQPNAGRAQAGLPGLTPPGGARSAPQADFRPDFVIGGDSG